MPSNTPVTPICAPVAGVTLPLGDVPDPAFASGALGDGIAIEPAGGPEGGRICAPCDGELISLQTTGHAFTIRSSAGAEILIHVGVDTVELNGEGFSVHVAEGQRVTTGDLLITVDLDRVRPQVPSLATMMVVANGDAFRVVSKEEDKPVAVGDPILVIEATGSAESDTAAEEEEGVEFSIPLKIAHGMHARPAAVLANAAKEHPGAVTVTCRGQTVNAKSVVALMKLGTRYDDELMVRVEGEGADEMSDQLLDLIAMGLGDPIAKGPAPEAEIAAVATSQTDAVSPTEKGAGFFAEGANVVLRGRCAVAGFAAGRVHRFSNELSNLPRDGAGVEVETERLDKALALLRSDLEAQINSTAPLATVAAAHQALLDDPELVEVARKDIASGRSAEWAWNASCKSQADLLSVMGDARMAERASDMRDIAVQVIDKMSGDGTSAAEKLSDLPAGTIVLAKEILPSEMTGLASGHLGAILMRDGGPTSHAAIIAAGLGIPTVVALGAEADRIPDKASIIIDAGLSQVTVFPSAIDLSVAEERMKDRASRKHEQRKAAQSECHLADGTRIEVFANLAQIGEGALAIAEGAEGCGLLRTEFLFQARTSAPSEEEQLAQYQAIVDELGGKPLIIRTMDVGGDKPLSYLPQPKEDNPFLGNRGIRISLQQPELLRTQIRAILRIKPFGAARIMVPMISSVAEMKAVRAIVSEEEKNLGRETPIAVGAMIEIPAAALISAQLAELCDFFSVGTNDLTQYALAMDRGNPAVAASVDALHPGVLRLIQLTADGAAGRDRLLAVCGGAASDPLAAPLLVGLGVRELSVAPAAIPEIKAVLSSLNLEHCQDVAQKALRAAGPEEVRALAKELFNERF